MGKVCKIVQELCDQLAGGLVGQIAMGVEFFLSPGDHDFRLVDRVHIQRHEDLPEMILGASSPEKAA